MTRQLQGVTPIDGIAEEMGFDMDEIYQVLGRDILKSSLLDDIDLYLECDDDSLYVMPTVMSPTHGAAEHSPHISTRSSTSPDSNFAKSPSGVNELFDIELDEETEFSCVDPDVAFPVSTFVNCANVEHPTLCDKNVTNFPSVDHNYVTRTPVKKAKYEPKVQMEKIVVGKEDDYDDESVSSLISGCAEQTSTINNDRTVQGVCSRTTPDPDVINSPQSSENEGSESNEALVVPEKAVETGVETTKGERPKVSQNAKTSTEVKIKFSIPRHPLIEEDCRYSCTQCKYTCTREILLKDHRAKAHGEKDLFKCSYCEYVGQLFKHLQKHMTRQHQVRLSSVKPGQQKLQVEPKICDTPNALTTEEAEPPNYGAECDQKGENKPEQNRDKVVQNKCQTTDDKSANLAQPIGDKVKVQDTNLRQKLIDFLSKLNRNLIIPPKWSGTIKLVSLLKATVTCDKMSKGAKLNVAPRLYYCDQCEKTFKQKRSLDAHLNVHRGSFPHKCDVCDKSFSCKNLLNQHQKTHSTERAHHCMVSGCAKSFRTNGRLRDHIMVVHSESKPFTCERCGRLYAREKDLCAHFNSHTENHKCTWDGCAKTFRDVYNLTQHYMTHTGEKPLHCSHCQYKCVQKHALDSHIKHHH